MNKNIKKLVLASSNAHKLEELKAILSTNTLLSGLEYYTAKDMKIDMSGAIENGSSFQDNALIKERYVDKALQEKKEDNYIVLSDDSGLCVDALNGEPGIFSARYMGEDTSYDIKNNNIISRVNEAIKKDKNKNRKASFCCAVAYAIRSGDSYKEGTTFGEFKGEIYTKILGDNGFGYDPIFYLPEYGKTSSELDPTIKNQLSHRYMALKAFMELFNE